ncbi:dTMP kinase [Sutterella faecalis]|uniref:Thymidylate kinase n=2 Tax=Sutterella TaxID=40544 RepID=A0AAI9SCJ4_9BURK|nr:MULTISPECIES: dTMP kinase [Sutterella]KAB7651764.1 dTMP kinase [Sutterella seckii]MBE5691616.1 dTMP kinase [Sutterella sp.]QDA54126.1 dTMP kinase [Sutterella faecalis]
MHGRFITIEGIDGAGKSTQTANLLKFLKDKGIDVVHTREPGGTPPGEKIREMLLSDEMGATAETLLFFAARAEHVEKVIQPALDAGRWVVSDRFTDATYAYQAGGKGFSGEKIEALEHWTLGNFEPDLTILFDIAPEKAAERLRARAGNEDRFERMGVDFFTRVRNAYLLRARNSPSRFLIVDAEQSPDEVARRIAQGVAQWL